MVWLQSESRLIDGRRFTPPPPPLICSIFCLCTLMPSLSASSNPLYRLKLLALQPPYKSSQKSVSKASCALRPECRIAVNRWVQMYPPPLLCWFNLLSLQANAFSLCKLKPPLQAEASLLCKLHISPPKNLLAKLPALSCPLSARCPKAVKAFSLFHCEA